MRLSRSLTLTCGVWLALAGQTALAQHPLFGGRGGNCCPQPCYTPCQPAPTTPTTPTTPPKMDQPPVVPQPEFAPEQAAAGGGENYAMNMIGDFIAPGGSVSLFSLPSVAHTLKVAVNQNVRPQDRVYFNCEWYNNIGTGPGGNSQNLDANIQTFGFEKTFMCGNVSVGVRLPINHLGASEGTADEAVNDTDFGDLAVILKALLVDDGCTAISAGLGVTFPTGPDTFAGAQFSNAGFTFENPHGMTFQPWVGALRASGDFYVHGFTAIDFAFDDDDEDIPSLWFLDLGAGYWLCRKDCDPCGGCCRVTGVVATGEIHWNVFLDDDNNGGIDDWFVVIEGIILQFGNRASLTLGLGQVISDEPKPYENEAIAQLNLFF